MRYPVLTLSATATTAVAAKRFVTHGDVQATVSGARVKGVAVMPAEVKRQFSIDVLGVGEVEAGAAIAKGADVQTDAQGRAIPLAGGIRAGTALAVAAGAGSTIEVLLTP